MTKEGSQHRHAFISSPKCTRYAEVFQKRNRDPEVAAGLSGLRVLKTTQSSFVDFHRCPNTTLPDAEDRILSTVISAEWKYSDLTGVDYCATWELVQDAILDTFAGPPVTGIASPSVQLTLYDSERLVLGKVKQISEMKMSLPNVHYFEFDMGRFHNPALQNTKNVFLPTDKPSGIIQATLRRNQLSKL
ncbi:Uro [Bugula neritina]|nr:Uro [Bugula neritina]